MFLNLQLFLVTISVCLVSCNVPVLLWSTAPHDVKVPSMSSLQQVGQNVFKTKYLKQFNLDNVLVFLQDTLSVEDLSSHDSEMQYVSYVLDQGNSIYLPSVEEPENVIQRLSRQDYNVIRLEPGISTSGLDLKKNEKNIVFINLPSTKTNPSRSNSMKKADEVIKSVISKIGNMADFTVFFSGKEPTVSVDETKSHVRKTREAGLKISDEDVSTPEGYFKKACVILYLREQLIIKAENEKITLPLDPTNDVTTNCHDNDNEIHFDYRDIAGYSQIKVDLRFAKKGTYWGMNSAEVKIKKTELIDFNLTSTDEVEYVPVGKSLACSKTLSFVSKVVSEEPPALTLIIGGLQVQPFVPDAQVAFDDSWDCVGFFTGPIWAGLFASIIATLILVWGLYMLSEVRTMDRFDDPKGKTIMIANTD